MKTLLVILLIAVTLAYAVVANQEWLEIRIGDADPALVEYVVVEHRDDCYSYPPPEMEYLSGNYITDTYRLYWETVEVGQYVCVKFTTQSGYSRMRVEPIRRLYKTYLPGVLRTTE